jgi:hypothetical protein
MVLVFGYMDLLIIIKWLTDYNHKEHTAPSIITTMINIPLNGGKIDGQSFIGSSTANQTISILILSNTIIYNYTIVIALITVPWMLFTKPLLIKKDVKNE